MATAEPLPNLPVPTSNAVPELETGDHLSRDEFERRYHAMPESCRAELVEGVVYMSSPVRFSVHGSPHHRLAFWTSYYELHTPGVLGADNTTVRLGRENEIQPDLLLFVLPELGGRVKFGDDDYLEGPPEFVAEVAASSVSIDLHAKLRVYRRNEVPEYMVWRSVDGEIDWFVLGGGEYQRQLPDENGVLRSKTLPGLWLDVPALLRRDLTGVKKTLDVGLASPEHVAFVERLKKP